MNLVDTHAHLNFPKFDNDRAEVIGRAQEAGIGIINVGTDLETSPSAVKLAEENVPQSFLDFSLNLFLQCQPLGQSILHRGVD